MALRFGFLVLLVVLGVGLGGCATPLKNESAVRPAPDCQEREEFCYLTGVELFEIYREQKLERIESRSKGYRAPSVPIAKLTGARTRYAALLIHGLNDSSYYMHDLAEVFEERGINAVGILLPGHGTRTEDTLLVKAEDWRREVAFGLELADLLGEKTLIVGFSLGAALGIDAVLQGREAYGLFLFSPALETQYPVLSRFACFPVLRNVLLQTELPTNPVKYTQRSVNSVCQLRRLMRSNLRRAGSKAEPGQEYEDDFAALGGLIRVPTFIGITYADARITPGSVLSFANHVNGPTKVVTFGAAGSQPGQLQNGGEVQHLASDPLPHSYLILERNEFNPQENPHFGALREELSRFIREQFGE